METFEALAERTDLALPMAWHCPCAPTAIAAFVPVQSAQRSIRG